jgi:hypothetical protein
MIGKDMSPRFRDLAPSYVFDLDELADHAEAIKAAVAETDVVTLFRSKPEDLANMALAGVEFDNPYTPELNQGGNL